MSRVYRRPRHILSVLAVLAALAPARTAMAGDMTPARVVSSDAQRWSVLDGRQFSGQFGALGKDAKGTDSWVFVNGMFLSESCLECGFPESPYLVRFEAGKTLFESTTRCPVSDATIAWRGSIEDGEIEGVYTWTKKRWYWTIEKKFWFKGTLAETSPEETAALN